MKYIEVIHMIKDELQLNSDDATFTNEHILFLCSKYRSYLLKVDNLNKKLLQTLSITSPIYQTICLQLEKANPTCNPCSCDGDMLRTTEPIPNVLKNVGIISLDTRNFYKSKKITLVSKERMKYVGNNKWLKSFIYGSIGPDKHIYLTSTNSNFKYLKEIQMTAVFDDAEQAAQMKCSCDTNNEDCFDLYEEEYPLEQSMIPALIQAVVKELSGSVYAPKDERNNASDDLHRLNIGQKNNNNQ